MTTLSPQELIEAKHFGFLVGDLRLLMHPTQRKIYEQFLLTKDLHTISTLLCSRKLGKSVLAFMALVSECIQKDNALCAYICPTLTSVSDQAEQLFNIVFAQCPDYLKPTLSKKEIIFCNGSKVMFAGCGRGIGDSFDSLRMYSFDACVVDEAGFPRSLREIVTGALLDTVRARKGWLWLLSSAPKQGSDHPFWEYVEESRQNGTLHEYTILDSHYTQAEIDKTIAEHGGINSTLCQRELFNQPIVAKELRVLAEWDEKYIKSIDRDEYFQFYHKYLSMDPSQGIDANVTLFAYYDYKQGILVVEDEVWCSGDITTRDIATGIINKKKELGYDKTYLQLSDNSDVKLIRDLGQKEYNLGFAPIENKGFKSTQISNLKDLLRVGRIMINPKCKFLIGCLTNVIWDTDKNDKPIDKFAKSNVWFHFDAVDALSYLCLNLNLTTNPIPVEYKATHMTVLPESYKPKNKSRLKDFYNQYGTDQRTK